jgi:hypothetical protein
MVQSLGLGVEGVGQMQGSVCNKMRRRSGHAPPGWWQSPVLVKESVDFNSKGLGQGVRV